MAEARIYKIDKIPQFQRGDGVVTTLLIGRDSAPGTGFTSGLTQFPPDAPRRCTATIAPSR